MSKDLFENITDDEAATLEWVLHNEGDFAADYFFEDPTVDGRIEELKRHNLVTENINGELYITELGRAALKEYHQLTEKRIQAEKQSDEQLESLKIIANSAQNQADSAIKELHILKEKLELQKEQVEALLSISSDAKSNALLALKELSIHQQQLKFAKQESADSQQKAKFSKVISILSLLISAGSLIVAILALAH